MMIGILLGINLYLANAKGIVGNQLPMPFGYGMANVLSGSMEPTFSKGTLLFVKETQNINKGDIVVYQSENELIVHRVMEVDGDRIVTKGDANNVSDVPFEREQIKGIVVGWIPYLGMVTSAFKTPVGIFGMIACAVFLLEGSFRRQKKSDERNIEEIKKEIRQLKEEKERSETDQ